MTIANRELYQIQQLPIFQNRMYDTAEHARQCPRGDIRLVEDQQTGLVYNADFKPELMVYDSRYQNEQAGSAFFQEHLEQVAGIIDRTMGRSSIIEVGCGKGYFLEMLSEEGFDVTGFDPAYEGDNPRVIKRYFDPDSGTRANGLILRHVLEHIQDPVGFLSQLAASNGGGGKIFIEVPCMNWICKRRAWFDIFYEHVNYFRISDFHRMFGKVIDSGHLFGGQYLYVVAELDSLRQPQLDESDRLDFPSDFLAGMPARRPAAIWGGASKGVIFALLRARQGHQIDIVIDINPAKQGSYLAGTGLQVLSPEEAMAALPPGSPIYVMNSNYLEEIKAMSNNAYQYIEVDHE